MTLIISTPGKIVADRRMSADNLGFEVEKIEVGRVRGFPALIAMTGLRIRMPEIMSDLDPGRRAADILEGEASKENKVIISMRVPDAVQAFDPDEYLWTPIGEYVNILVLKNFMRFCYGKEFQGTGVNHAMALSEIYSPMEVMEIIAKSNLAHVGMGWTQAMFVNGGRQVEFLTRHSNGKRTKRVLDLAAGPLE